MPWYWPFKQNDDTSDHSSLIEGINDDILLLLVIVACLFALWIYYTRFFFKFICIFILFISIDEIVLQEFIQTINKM
jgi:hypothetical protein